MKKTLSLLLALVMVVSLFAGCGAKEPEAVEPEATQPVAEATTPVAEDVATESETPLKMQWYQGIGVETMFENPHTNVQSLLPYMIWDRLSELNTKTNTRYWMLAEDISVSDDYKTATIKVREGVKWHDGEDFTADDVVFTIYYATLNPLSNFASDLLSIEGAQEVMDGTADTMTGISVDGNTITLKFVNPMPLAVNNLGNLHIYPAHCFGENPDYAALDSHDYWKNPIGTGAYKISEVQFPDYCKLVRNDDYWGEKAGIKNVTFTSYETLDAGIMAMAAGDVDFGTTQLITDKMTANMVVEQNADVKIIDTFGYSYKYFRFWLGERADGNNKAALENAKVREAFNLLIDEEALASVYGDQAVASQVLFSPRDPQYPAHLQRDWYNPELAVQMLTDNGWNFDDTLDIMYYHTDDITANVVAYIAQCMEDAGIKVSTYLCTDTTGDPNWTGKNYDLLYAGGNVAADYQGNAYYQLTAGGDKVGKVENQAAYDAAYEKYDYNAGEARLAGAVECMEMNWADNYLLPAFFINKCVAYDTGNISVPEVVFEMEGTNHFEWENWKVLN